MYVLHIWCIAPVPARVWQTWNTGSSASGHLNVKQNSETRLWNSTAELLWLLRCRQARALTAGAARAARAAARASGTSIAATVTVTGTWFLAQQAPWLAPQGTWGKSIRLLAAGGPPAPGQRAKPLPDAGQQCVRIWSSSPAACQPERTEYDRLLTGITRAGHSAAAWFKFFFQ